MSLFDTFERLPYKECNAKWGVSFCLCREQNLPQSEIIFAEDANKAETLPRLIMADTRSPLISPKNPSSFVFHVFQHQLCYIRSLVQTCVITSFLFCTPSLRFYMILCQNVIEKATVAQTKAYLRHLLSLKRRSQGQHNKLPLAMGEWKSFHERCRFLSEMRRSSLLQFFWEGRQDAEIVPWWNPSKCAKMTPVTWPEWKQKKRVALFVSVRSPTTQNIVARLPINFSQIGWMVSVDLPQILSWGNFNVYTDNVIIK